jgi:hypothetical protein
MVSDYFFGIFKLLYENDLSEYVSVSNKRGQTPTFSPAHKYKQKTDKYIE